MRFGEFKFWLEGFCESITDAPTPAQWKRIKEQLDRTLDYPVSSTLTGGFGTVTTWPNVTVPCATPSAFR